MRVDRSAQTGPGAAGFSDEFWATNYAEPQTMDGIYNAHRRAVALKAFFDSEYIDINSIVDLGFGLGELLRAFVQEFMPLTVIGIEPSPHAYAKVSRVPIVDVDSMHIELLQKDVLSWCQHPAPLAPFDLCICTSVFQYLTDPEIELTLPILANRVKYLYFSVPIDTELQFQTEALNFEDRYAIARTRDEYLSMLADHFTIVSNRLLESKDHFDEQSTLFTDFLFRF